MSNGSVQGLSPTTLEYQSNCPDAQVVFPAQEKSTKSERTRATAARPRDQGILAAEKKERQAARGRSWLGDGYKDQDESERLPSVAFETSAGQ